MTDLHLSKFSDNNRTPDLLDFCKNTLPILAPDFVLVSGDLVDSKSVTKMDSMQYEEEWKMYENVLHKCEVDKKIKWLDIRGNHDTFNVPHVDHPENMYRKYSVQGRHHPKSYLYTHRKSFGNYSFVGLDVCPEMGPKRPYNFVGLITQEIFDLLNGFTRQMESSNASVWFGHYPTSTVITNNYPLRQIISKTSGVYMCGHLHTWGTMVPKMYTLQPEGYLELELGDWRDTRSIRIGVYDHDLFSFIDVHLHQWPVVLVTNPKDANFIMPNKEPVHRIRTSTHIRILAWSLAPITSVKVSLDNQYLGEASPVNKGPLYTLPWNPKLYTSSEGHIITVIVQDSLGNTGRIEHSFSATGTPVWEFGYYASILLHGNHGNTVRVWYFAVWFSLFFPLVLLRLAQFRVNCLTSYLDHRYILGAYKLANSNTFFIPLNIYFCYTMFFPLMYGELIEGQYGWVYLNGLSIGDNFISEYSPYITEALQNTLFVGPILAYFIHRIATHSAPHSHPPRTALSSLRTRLYSLMTALAFTALIILHTIFTLFTVYLPYGGVCLLCSPARLWTFLMFAWLFYQLPTLVRGTHIPGGEHMKASQSNGGSKNNHKPLDEQFTSNHASQNS